jgi:hypothetical protein
MSQVASSSKAATKQSNVRRWNASNHQFNLKIVKNGEALLGEPAHSCNPYIETLSLNNASIMISQSKPAKKEKFKGQKCPRQSAQPQLQTKHSNSLSTAQRQCPA